MNILNSHFISKCWTKQPNSIEKDFSLITPKERIKLKIYHASLLAKLAKKLFARQQVVATAMVFYNRFYLKNEYCDTFPAVVIVTCFYLATKIEEIPMHLKAILNTFSNVLPGMISKNS